MDQILKGWKPGIGCVNLGQFRDGITIPEYSVTVPWLISRRTLFQCIPQNRFCTGTTRHWYDWPKLRFTCMGVTANFCFNFKTHPDGMLTSIEMMVDDTPVSTTPLGLPTALLKSIGEPAHVSTNDFRWFDRDTFVECWVSVARRKPHEAKIYSYSRLKIFHHERATFRWKDIVVNDDSDQ